VKRCREKRGKEGKEGKEGKREEREGGEEERRGGGGGGEREEGEKKKKRASLPGIEPGSPRGSAAAEQQLDGVGRARRRRRAGRA